MNDTVLIYSSLVENNDVLLEDSSESCIVYIDSGKTIRRVTLKKREDRFTLKIIVVCTSVGYLLASLAIIYETPSQVEEVDMRIERRRENERAKRGYNNARISE